MQLRRYLFWLASIPCLFATETGAAELVRSATLIESIPIQGVTLATPPKEAVERLLAAGYKAGPIQRFEDWKDPGIQFARGGPGAPEGESWVTLTRYKGRLIEITEMTNKPKQRFDATAEISRDGLSASGDSIMGLLMLAASKGTEIDVMTQGRDAVALLDAIEELVAGRFGEEC